MVFPKKIALEYDLSYIIGKDDISFPENMILPVRQKIKDDFSQKKKKQKYDIFFKHAEKMVFSKRTALRHDSPCIILKDGIFFPKTW